MSSITPTPSISSTTPSVSEPSPAQDFRTVASSMQNALIERDRTIEQLLQEIATLKLEASGNQQREVNYQEMEVPDIEGVVSHIEAQDAALSALIQEHEVARQRLLQQSSMTKNLSKVNATLDQENASLKQALEAKNQVMLSQMVEIQQKERAELEREQKREANTQEIEALLKEIEVDERAREAKIQNIVKNGQKRAEEIEALVQKNKVNKQELEANKKKRETLMQEFKALPLSFKDNQKSEALMQKLDTLDQDFETLLQELEATKQVHEANEQRSEADRKEIELLTQNHEELIKNYQTLIEKYEIFIQKRVAKLQKMKANGGSYEALICLLNENNIELEWLLKELKVEKQEFDVLMQEIEAGKQKLDARLQQGKAAMPEVKWQIKKRVALMQEIEADKQLLEAAIKTVEVHKQECEVYTQRLKDDKQQKENIFNLLRNFIGNKALSETEIQLLIDILKNENRHYASEIRVIIADILFQQSSLSEQFRPFLEAVLQDKDEQVKAAVAVVLGRHFSLPDTTLQIVLEVIANKNGKYRAAHRIRAADILSQQSGLSEQFRPFLEAVLQDKDEQVKAAVAVVLGCHFSLPDTTLQILLEVIANKNGKYRAAHRVNAAFALLKQSTLSEQFRPFLEAVLQDKDERVKAAVTIALGRHFSLPDTTLQILLEVIANKSGYYEAVFRINAGTALLKQSTLSEQVHLFLEAVLQDEEERVKAIVVPALAYLFPVSDSTIQILLEVIANKNGVYEIEDRVNAATALNRQPILSEQVRLFLEAVLQDKDEQVKAAVAVALTYHFPASDTALQILLEVVANKNRIYEIEDRVNAATALLKKSSLSEQFRPFLEAVLQDKDEQVKAAVAVALTWHFQVPDAILQILLEVIANKNGIYALGDRVNAATALKRRPILSEQFRPFLEAVLQDKEERVRATVAVALGWHFPVSDTTLQILLEVIANKNETYGAAYRVGAATALRQQSTLSEHVRPFLEAVLEDKDEQVKAAIAVALGWHFPVPDTTLQILLEVIANKNQQYGAVRRANAAAALKRQRSLSEQVRPFLEAMLQNKEERVRAAVAAVLGWHFPVPDTTIQILLEVTANTNGIYEMVDRVNAATALKRQPSLSEQVRLFLEELLQDKEERVRAAVAVALGWHFLAPDTALQILLEVIANKNQQYGIAGRVIAALALSRQPTLSEQIRPFLEAVLQDKEEKIKAAVAVALGCHFPVTDTTLQILLEVIANKNGIYEKEDRVNAANALIRQSTLSEQIRPSLEAVLQDKDEQVKAAVAVVLGCHFPVTDTTLQILLEVIANKNGIYEMEDRVSSATALSRQSALSEQVRLFLEAVLQDKDEQVKAAVAVALTYHFPASDTALQILLEVIADKNGMYDMEDRVSAATALKRQPILSEQARPFLEAVLQVKDEKVRAKAAIALGLYDELPDTGIPILLDVLASKGKLYRVKDKAEAAFILGKQPTLLENTRSALETALQDQNEKIKAQAAIALGRHGKLPNTGMSILLDILVNKDDRYEVKDRESARLALEAALQNRN